MLDNLTAVQYSYLIPLLPLIAACIAGFFGAKWLKGASHWPIWLGVGASAVLSFMLLAGFVKHSATEPEGKNESHAAAVEHVAPLSATKILYTWAELGDANAPVGQFLHVDVGFFFDPLTCVMLCVVCGIGFFITVFAAGYMKGESGYFRFFAYLGLFLFSMTMLVMGENLIMLYLGWEGVGLCSYLLIGYYYDKPSAVEAAKKAFLVNRVGDFGFGLGIMLSFLAFGTVSYFGGSGHAGLLTLANGENLTAFQQTAMHWIPFLLMVGAFGKSAQFPLYVWLPDAMEGPTPVSALIHAATMVTAGIYMIARCGPLFVGEPAAMWMIAFIGMFTALFAGAIALRQYDLKKVFAYSTISQLGFMFVAVGVLAPVAGVFHLITHAFFKALLFLSSGVVMHAMGGELDMRKMSGLKKVLPKTRWLMLIGCLALAGFPMTAGFFSKDEIVGAAWERSHTLGVLLLIAAFMTAYYTFRLYFRVFAGPEVIPQSAGGHGHDDHAHGHTQDDHGQSRVSDNHSAGSLAVSHAAPGDHAQTSRGHAASHDDHGHGDHAHNHEPFIMMFPLYILAFGALAAGFFLFQNERLEHFLGQSPSFVAAFQKAKTVEGERLIGGENGVIRAGTVEVNPVPFGQHDGRDPDVIDAEHSTHLTFMVISSIVAILGIALAYEFHLRNRKAADRLEPTVIDFARILDHKFWVDEIYQAAIVEPLRSLGRIFFAIDRIFVDGIVNTIGLVPQLGGFALKLSVQRGYLQGYATAMLFGVIAILLFVFLH